MTPRDLALRELADNGYTLDRHGASHDIYHNEKLNCSITVKRHKFSENALRYIRKEIKENKTLRRQS